MDLREYRHRQRTTYADIAKRIGCSRNHLNAIATGKLRASLYLAKVIVMVTNGEVGLEDIPLEDNSTVGRPKKAA